jgi:AcrR family transcriptional regulator
LATPVKRPRRYDSTRRQAQARDTQRAILRAAHDLFVEQGYGRTTISAIAAAAGVSVETIYGAFGSKAALLHRVWDVTVGGDDQDIALHERPEVLSVRAEPNLARRLHLHAELSTAIVGRFGPFLLALQGAAGVEPAAAEMVAEIDRQRLAGMTIMAREAAATGQLAVSEEECRDVLWSTTDAVLRHRLVVERGWTEERYAQWLGDLWERVLVSRPAGRGGRA